MHEASRECVWLRSMIQPRLEISVSMDISVLAFYGYIGGYFFMNIDILKINKNTLKFIEILSKSVKMTLIIKYIHCNEFLISK